MNNNMNWGKAHIGTVNGIMLYALFDRTKYNPMLQYRIGVIQHGILMNAVRCDYNNPYSRLNGRLMERGGMQIPLETANDFFVTEWSRQ